MEAPTTYCAYVRGLKIDDVHRHYHDHEYGFPLNSDDELFGRLVLEINQAGLSWTTILKKKDNFYRAYAGFSIEEVAGFDEMDIHRLLNDPGIIRNRLKVQAAIHNARSILKLQDSYGSFSDWLDHHHPMNRDQWVKLFKKTFRFTGGEITNEFLMSTGYLPGAHEESCPIWGKIVNSNPKWMDPAGK